MNGREVHHELSPGQLLNGEWHEDGGVERDGARRTFSVKPDLRLFSDTRPPIRDLGVEPAKACVVGRLFPNGPALLAGLRENDEIVMLNGEVLWHPHMFAERVRESEGPVVVTYRRGRAMHTVSVVPIQPQGAERKMLGVQWDSMGLISIDHPSVWSQLAGSASLMIDTLHTLMTSKDIKVEHLSGPVGVFRIYCYRRRRFICGLANGLFCSFFGFLLCLATDFVRLIFEAGRV